MTERMGAIVLNEAVRPSEAQRLLNVLEATHGIELDDAVDFPLEGQMEMIPFNRVNNDE